MDRRTAQALDSYLTREPPWGYDESVYRCGSCGAFLKTAPDGRRDWDIVTLCSGEPQVFEETHSDDVLAIIGEEHRGEVFTRAFPPSCGGKTAQRYGGDGDEIAPNDAEQFRHAPHYFVGAYGQCSVEVRVCAACGAANENPLV